MKRFSTSKLMSAVLVSLLVVTLVGCKTTTPVEEVPAPAPVVLPETKAEQPAPAQEVVVAEPAKEEVVQEKTEEVVAPEKTEKVVAQEKTEEVVVPQEPKVEYPFGIEPIVKSDNGSKVFDLFVVHTNDVHGRVEATDSNIGYSRLSTMLQVARSITDNILLLDAGDTTHGTNIVNMFKGETAGVLLDMLGYDAIAPGNHDFNYGVQRLVEAAKLANQYSNLKVLSANVTDDNGNLLFQPYQIYVFNGFKVAVIGLTTPDTALMTHPKNVEGVNFMSDVVVQNAQAAVDMAHKYADYVIVLGHVGSDASSVSGVTSQLICENINGIDLFVDGHSHTMLPQGNRVNGTLIVQAGEYMENLGVVDILVKNNKAVSENAFLIKASDVADPANSELATQYGITSVPEDPKVVSYISSQQARLDAVYNEVIANVPFKLDGERENVRTKQTNLSSMITKAMTEASGADFTITNGGGIRASIDAGDVTIGEVITVLPFTNIVTVCEIKGSDVYAALEHGYSNLPTTAGSFSQTDLKVVYNKYAKPGKRIIRVILNGKAIDKNATYRVATNDFMAAGGDGYTMFGNVVAEGDLLSDVLINYLKANYAK